MSYTEQMLEQVHLQAEAIDSVSQSFDFMANTLFGLSLVIISVTLLQIFS